ncbi:hypothetical protein [Maribacter sp. 2308TA10-17]|uniref:hypothetical protein n=1 Tax=Maribacter sp. 2308TA10-17 TaxID=3386276 RepID=UPI0039BCEABA
MNKILFTLIISALSLSLCNAQKIESQKVFGGYKYAQNGNDLSLSELSKVLKTNTKSFQTYKKAKTKAVFSYVFAGIGGGLTGYPVGTALGGGKPNWTLAGIGVGCLAVAFPLAASADKKIKESVDIYNSSLDPRTHVSKTELKIVGNINGIGLSLNF